MLERADTHLMRHATHVMEKLVDIEGKALVKSSVSCLARRPTQQRYNGFDSFQEVEFSEIFQSKPQNSEHLEAYISEATS